MAKMLKSQFEKLVQMMTLGWPLTFIGKVEFASLYIYMGKILKSHFLKMYLRLMAETYNVWLI